MGTRRDEASMAALKTDEFLMRDMKEETDVIAAINH
jgi:hypothetical protein